MPKVSILIATYNRADLLPATLESALSQTYRDLEVIVSDNASTDITPELMQAYTARDGRVKYIRKPVNEGVIANYHTALRAASGEYLAFFDSDDLFHPTKIEKQLRAFDLGGPRMGAVHTGFFDIDQSGVPIRRTLMLDEGDLFEKLLCYEAQIWLGAVLFRRECIERTGMLDASVTQAADVDYFLRMTRLGYRVGCVQEALYYHRYHPTNQSKNVFGLAQALFTIYKRLYADPAIEAKYGAWKNRTFANLHMDCSGRLLALGEYEQAKEQIAQALMYRPEWSQSPEHWVRALLYDYAFGPECRDAIEFVMGWMSHLPPAAALLLQQRDRILALAHIGTALRALYANDVREGRAQLAAAMQHCPNLLYAHVEAFAAFVQHFIARLPTDDPAPLINLLFEHWPNSADSLAIVRARVLSDASITRAFYAWQAGNWSAVRKQVIRAMSQRPDILFNWSVMSIFMRSLTHVVDARLS